MDETIKNELKDLLGSVEFDVSMKTKTSFRVGGPADVLAIPGDEDELKRLVRYVREKGLPSFILGRGTNLLVLDGGIRGVVIDLSRFNTLEVRNEGIVYAGAGAPLPKLVYFAMDNSLTGLEFASGIPGSVGGAIIMNAGAADSEIKDVVESVKLMSDSGEVSEIKRESLVFNYRNLSLPGGSIVLGATFRLKAGKRDLIKERVHSILNARKSKQPLDFPNAGCIFKNPPSNHAGRIIDQAGLKGLQFGGAKVSELHANFIVNSGAATAKDILSLINDLQEKVYERKGVSLEPEIKIVGETERAGVRVKP